MDDDDAQLTHREATDLARRITLDDLHVRAGPRMSPDGVWVVWVTLADWRQIVVTSWEDWRRRREGGP